MTRSRPLVLYVDDQKTFCLLAKAFLEREGFDVIDADRGTQAISKALAYCPDLIILDIMMPGLSGIETYAILRGQEEIHNIPVIFATAMTSEQDIVDGLDLGAFDYVTKPFSQKELGARVRAALRKQGKADDDNPDRGR